MTRFLVIISLLTLVSGQQLPSQQTSGALTQTVYQFLKQSQLTSKFVELLDRTSQQSNDRSVIEALSNPGQGNQNTGGMYTVFVPANDAFNQIPSDIDQLRNDVNNLVVKEYLTLERIKQMNGRNMSRTFGYMPRLTLRVVPNHYSRQLMSSSSSSSNLNQPQVIQPRPQKRQINQMGPGYYGQQPQQVGSSTPYYGPPTTSSPYGQSTPMFPGQSTVSSFYGQPNNYYGSTTKYYGPPTPANMVNPMLSLNGNQPFNPNQPNSMNGQFVNMTNPQSDLSIYEQYNQLYGSSGSQVYDGPNISPKLPQDELYLLNSAIILDKFELTNGIVYLINSYPRYYDRSLYALLRENAVNGLTQNLNFWISRAEQAYRQGDESLRNALNAFGTSTYFLPTDQAFNKYTYRDRLNNNSFLVDVLLRSHRVNDMILFDHYLDNSAQTFYTDTRQPVSTKHRRVNNIDDIEISIGHVKGKILPDFRNIYCASGVIHLVDTVLGVPSRSAYQELQTIPELSTFRALVDRSAKYRQLLDQAPVQDFFATTRTRREVYRNKRQFNQFNNQPPMNQQQMNQQQMNSSFGVNMNPNMMTNSLNTMGSNFNNFNPNQPGYNQFGSSFGSPTSRTQLYTILAPSDSALLTVKDDILKNDTLVDQILSAHIITDNNNRIFYTDHDDSLFQNGQTYPTLLPGNSLVATVTADPTGVANDVALALQSNPQIKGNIINGNARVSNGVIHVVDSLLFPYASSDITTVLDKYSNMNLPNSPAFSQFVDALRSTGIFNDLKQPARQYTLFIPTNEALARYQDIITGNDIERKKNLIYRHLCLDQNLQSNSLPGTGTGNSQLPYNPNNQQQQQQFGQQQNSNQMNNPNFRPTTSPTFQNNQPQFNTANPNSPNLNTPNYNQNNPNYNLNNPNLNNQNPNNPNFNQQTFGNNQLICRNALGQDVTLTKDSYGLITGQGFAHAKVINKFPGVYSSAYLLERPLYNSNNVQTQARAHYNSANVSFRPSIQFITFLCLVFLMFI